MESRFGRDTWSLVVPDGWRAWHDPECATLVDGGDGCALQLSAAFKTDGEVLDSDLQQFAADLIARGLEYESAVAGEFSGVVFTFMEGDRFWRQWFLWRAEQLLFVTFNCESKPPDSLVADVDRALCSLIDPRDRRPDESDQDRD